MPNKKRYSLSADVDKELYDLVVNFANKEADGNVSYAIRKILREYLSISVTQEK